METTVNHNAALTGGSQRQIALVAGFALLLQIVFVIFAEALVMAKIIVPGAAAATASNIMAHEAQFRFGVFCYLMLTGFDLVAAWALYVFLKPLKNPLNLLAAWSRFAYTIFLGLALVNYYGLVQLLGQTDLVSRLDPAGLQAQVMLSLNAFRNVWDVGYVFFGLHLLLLGIVLFQSRSIPKWLGILVLLGGASYLIDYGGKIILVNFKPFASLIFGFDEAIFMVWLLFWGGKQPKSVAK